MEVSFGYGWGDQLAGHAPVGGPMPMALRLHSLHSVGYGKKEKDGGKGKGDRKMRAQ